MAAMLLLWLAVSAALTLAFYWRSAAAAAGRLTRKRSRPVADDRILEIAERCRRASSDLQTGADHYDEVVVPVAELEKIIYGSSGSASSHET